MPAVETDEVVNLDAQRQAHDADELRALEHSARRAAALEPLAAAVKMNVDSATLDDLFESEDWWRPYRTDFTFVRLIVDGAVLATRVSGQVGQVGEAGEVGTLDKPLVKLARRQGAASAAVERRRPAVCSLAAARLPALDPTGFDPRARTGSPVLGSRRPASRPPRRRLAHSPAAVRARGRGHAGGRGADRVRRAAAAGGRRCSTPVDPADLSLEVRRAPLARSRRPRRTAPPWQTTRRRIARARAERKPPSPSPPHSDVRLDQLCPRCSGATACSTASARAAWRSCSLRRRSAPRASRRTFVLKRLRPELASDKDAVAQFIDEARLQASLVHSNIVPVFDFGMVGRRVLHGPGVHRRARPGPRDRRATSERSGRGSPAAIAYFVAHEMLQALAYAHDDARQDRRVRWASSTATSRRATS